MRGTWKGFKDFSHILTTLVNTILLLPIYLVGVGLTSIVAKVKKKEFLEGKLSPETKSYWNDLNVKKKPLQEYYQQF